MVGILHIHSNTIQESLKYRINIGYLTKYVKVQKTRYLSRYHCISEQELHSCEINRRRGI